MRRARYAKGRMRSYGAPAPLPTAFERGKRRNQATGSSFLTPAAAATSAAKSLSAFSMPSPSWKRSNAFSVIGEPASLPACGDDVGDRGLVVDHEQLAQQGIFLAELGHRAFDHLLDDVGRLAAFLGLLDRDRALALDQRGVEALGVERQRVGGGDVHRNLLAERLQRLGRGRALKRDQHADLAHARRDRIVDIADHRALADLEHRGAAQRLVLADGGDVVGQLLLDRAAGGIGSRLQRLDVAVGLAAPGRRRCGRTPGTARSWRRSRFPN